MTVFFELNKYDFVLTFVWTKDELTWPSTLSEIKSFFFSFNGFRVVINISTNWFGSFKGVHPTRALIIYFIELRILIANFWRISFIRCYYTILFAERLNSFIALSSRSLIQSIIINFLSQHDYVTKNYFSKFPFIMQ